MDERDVFTVQGVGAGSCRREMPPFPDQPPARGELSVPDRCQRHGQATLAARLSARCHSSSTTQRSSPSGLLSSSNEGALICREVKAGGEEGSFSACAFVLLKKIPRLVHTCTAHLLLSHEGTCRGPGITQNALRVIVWLFLSTH